MNAIRTAIAFWETGLSPSGPKPDGQLGAIVEVMLGTSARIGEVLAIRRRDIDIVSAPPSIRISGTIVAHRGEPTLRQCHPKTAKSRRTVALPAFAAETVRLRLARRGDASLDALLFCNRDGGPLTTNNVRRQLRHVLDLAGIEGVTPHMFRRSRCSTTSAATRWSTRRPPRCSTALSGRKRRHSRMLGVPLQHVRRPRVNHSRRDRNGLEVA